MTSIEPELWVDRAGAAVAFYQAAFGASVLHRVGGGDDIVAQLSVGGARFVGRDRKPVDEPLQPAADRRHHGPDAAGC